MTRNLLNPAAENATFRFSRPANLIHLMSALFSSPRSYRLRSDRLGPQPIQSRPRVLSAAATIAHDWIEAGNAHLVESVSGDPQWWSTLNDPVLDSLIQTAYGQNLYSA